jgi:hypothetical protein
MLSKGEQTMSYGFLHSRSDGSHRRIGPQRLGKPLRVAIALLAGAVAGHVLCAAPVDVPVIKGDLGPCSADFTVLDSTNKPVYDAKVHVTIRYGFMNQENPTLKSAPIAKARRASRGCRTDSRSHPWSSGLRAAIQKSLSPKIPPRIAMRVSMSNSGNRKLASPGGWAPTEIISDL